MSPIFIILGSGPYSDSPLSPKIEILKKFKKTSGDADKDVIKTELLISNYPCLTESLEKMSTIFIILGFGPYSGPSPDPKNRNFEKVQNNLEMYIIKMS